MVTGIMFQSVPRRPICEIGVNTVRLQSRRTVEKCRVKSETIPWLGKSMGLLLSWLQRAGVGASEAAGSGQKRKGLLSIFVDHCSFVTGQRLRRAYQIGELYSNLYSERTRWTLVGSIWRRLQSKHAPTGKLMAALAGVFMWENEKIQDEEVNRSVLVVPCFQWCILSPFGVDRVAEVPRDFTVTSKVRCVFFFKSMSRSDISLIFAPLSRSCLELQALEAVKHQGTSSGKLVGQLEGWEVVMEKKDFKVWKRPIPNSHLYEYRGQPNHSRTRETRFLLLTYNTVSTCLRLPVFCKLCQRLLDI